MDVQRELSGWAAIADHLGVSVRAAQGYERDLGLPVHRLPGAKGRVWAFAEALDSWKLNAPTALAATSDGSGDAGELVASPHGQGGTGTVRNNVAQHPVVPDRRLWLRTAAFGTAALVSGTGLALAALRLLRPVPTPTAYRIEGATLIILGKDGREIWHHEFPLRPYEGFYSGNPGRSCTFADLDGDGRIETLFISFPEGNAPEPYLTCFNDRGKLLWEFHPSGTVADTAGREFLPPYFINDFEVVPLGKSRQSKIMVACNHHFSFPAQVVMLDCHGKLLSRYWHRGHLTHIAVGDLDGSGEPMVLLGGVNDAADYKLATLLGFDHRSFSGGSVSANGTPYFSGVDRGTEKVEMFFPKTLASERKEFNRVKDVRIHPNRIGVDVAEDIVESDPDCVVYELDFHLAVTAVAFSDALRTKYVETFGDSRRAEEAVRRDEERCRNEVQIIRRA
jgi:hypothetical protein